MSINEQRAATERARQHRLDAERLLAAGFTDTASINPTDVQVAIGLAAICHLLLAVEDRLAYGSQSMLDGTISCKECRAIVLDENAADHASWHRVIPTPARWRQG